MGFIEIYKKRPPPAKTGGDALQKNKKRSDLPTAERKLTDGRGGFRPNRVSRIETSHGVFSGFYQGSDQFAAKRWDVGYDSAPNEVSLTQCRSIHPGGACVG